MRRLTEIRLPFPGFEPEPVTPAVLPGEVVLPRPDIINGHDAAWKQAPNIVAAQVSRVIRPIIQPNPQNGNKRGKRL